MKKIHWGVLGTAGIAKGCTIPGMQQAENCILTAIAGRSMEKAQSFKQMFGFEKVYGSYDALLADPEIEAVYIPLPNDMHCEWAIKAMEAGKHVLCEKPLAPTVAEIEKMIACADKNGVLLMEAFAYLHSPIVQAVKQELEKIGDILYMESAFLYSDYKLSNIRMRRETFGGSTYDVGCYCTSQILWMLDDEPESVQACGCFTDQKIDNLTTGLLTFKNGAKAAFTCGMLLATEQDKRIDRFQIHGTKGHITSEAQFNQEGDLKYTICVDGATETKCVHAPQNYRLEVEQFGRCIADGEAIHVSHEFTLRNARTLERILRCIGY